MTNTSLSCNIKLFGLPASSELGRAKTSQHHENTASNRHFYSIPLQTSPAQTVKEHDASLAVGKTVALASALRFGNETAAVADIPITSLSDAQKKQFQELKIILGQDQAGIHAFQALCDLWFYRHLQTALNDPSASTDETDKKVRADLSQALSLDKTIATLYQQLEAAGISQERADNWVSKPQSRLSQLTPETFQERLTEGWKLLAQTPPEQRESRLEDFKSELLKEAPMAFYQVFQETLTPAPLSQNVQRAIAQAVQGKKPALAVGNYETGRVVWQPDGSLKLEGTINTQGSASGYEQLRFFEQFVNTRLNDQQRSDLKEKLQDQSLLTLGTGGKGIKEPKTTWQKAKEFIPFTVDEEAFNVFEFFTHHQIAQVYSAHPPEPETGWFGRLLNGFLSPFKWIGQQISKLFGRQAQDAPHSKASGDSEGEQLVLLPFLKQIFKRDRTQSATTPLFSHTSAQLLYENLSALPAVQLYVNGEPLHIPWMDEALTAYRQDRAAYEIGHAYYLEAPGEKQALIPIMLGVLSGYVGESAVEKFVPEGSQSATRARMALLYGVDTLDNFFGQGAITLGGLKPGDNPIPALARASVSALGGATLGLTTAMPRAYVLSHDHVSAEARALIGGFGSFGTALAIPLNVRSSLHEKTRVIQALMHQKVFPVSEQEIRAAGGERALAQKMALEELMTSVGMQASVNAFTLVPVLSGSVMMLERLGVPRPMVQKLFMSIAPAAENILTGALMTASNWMGRGPEAFNAHLNQIALNQQSADPKEFESLFGNRYSLQLAQWLTSNWIPYVAAAGVAAMYGYIGLKGGFKEPAVHNHSTHQQGSAPKDAFIQGRAVQAGKTAGQTQRNPFTSTPEVGLNSEVNPRQPFSPFSPPIPPFLPPSAIAFKMPAYIAPPVVLASAPLTRAAAKETQTVLPAALNPPPFGTPTSDNGLKWPEKLPLEIPRLLPE